MVPSVVWLTIRFRVATSGVPPLLTTAARSTLQAWTVFIAVNAGEGAAVADGEATGDELPQALAPAIKRAAVTKARIARAICMHARRARAAAGCQLNADQAVPRGQRPPQRRQVV